jgi:hypothetical protein
MTTYNHFFVGFVRARYEDKWFAPYLSLFPRIWIDGVPFAEGASVAIRELWESCQYPGEYSLFYCNCGDPECDRPEESLVVTHTKDTIIWNVLTPVQDWALKLPEGTPREELKEHKTLEHFFFIRKHYIAVVENAIRNAPALMRMLPPSLADLDGPYTYNETRMLKLLAETEKEQPAPSAWQLCKCACVEYARGINVGDMSRFIDLLTKKVRLVLKGEVLVFQGRAKVSQYLNELSEQPPAMRPRAALGYASGLGDCVSLTWGESCRPQQAVFLEVTRTQVKGIRIEAADPHALSGSRIYPL